MVRFADGPATEATIALAADPQTVWPVISDITLPVAHSKELQAVNWQGAADRPAVGAQFIGHNSRWGRDWETYCTVTEYDPPRRFTYEVWSPDEHISTWGYQLTPDGGGTILRQWTVLGPGRSGLTAAIRDNPDQEERLIAGRLGDLRKQMTCNLQAVRSAVAGDG